MFNLDLLPEKKLPRVNIDGKRHYVTPDGTKCISVTTGLSVLAKKAIAKWKDKIGKKDANEYSSSRANYGTILHNACEEYVKEDTIPVLMPNNQFAFNHMKVALDNYVTKVYGIEIPLYSTELQAAGTADLVCDYKGKLSILDYKSSSKPKEEDWILSYFLQSTTYALMLEEMYGMRPEQIVILVAPDLSPVQEFIKPVSEYEKMTRAFWRHLHAGEFDNI